MSTLQSSTGTCNHIYACDHGDDEYGKDEYSNCCNKEACLKKIGVNKYFNEKVEFVYKSPKQI